MKIFEKLDRGTLNAMDAVIDTAKRTNTKIVVAKDNKIVYINHKEAKRRLRNVR